MKTIVVGSQNPVKIQATLQGFQKIFPNERFEAQGVTVTSNVSDQPTTDAETYQGADNRVKNAAKKQPDADFWVGLEGGIESKGNEIEAFAWMVIRSRDGHLGKARTSTFQLPPEIAKRIREGQELGAASDSIFNTTNIKQAGGTIGLLTDNVIDRTAYYREAVILALIPFKNPGLYQ